MPQRHDRTAGLAAKAPRRHDHSDGTVEGRGKSRLSMASWGLGVQSGFLSLLIGVTSFCRSIPVACLCIALSSVLIAEEKPADAKPAVATPAGTTHVDTKLAEPPKPPTDQEIAQIQWQEFSADNTYVCPFARDFSHNEEFPERMVDWERFLSKFAVWEPGNVTDATERVHNLISACALMDIGQGQFESELPLYVYQRLRREVPDAKLKDILAYMAFHPNEAAVISTAPELNLDIGVGDDQIRERLQVVAVKMLGRLLGKLPWDPPAQP